MGWQTRKIWIRQEVEGKIGFELCSDKEEKQTALQVAKPSKLLSHVDSSHVQPRQATWERPHWLTDLLIQKVRPFLVS